MHTSYRWARCHTQKLFFKYLTYDLLCFCVCVKTTGDSAKALAVSGLSVVGRDHYGVFPLKGKMLNVRNASASQMMGNAEITALKQILGLQAGAAYKDNKSLRYGRVVIFADADNDGSHIKGLVINLFAHCWPSLLQLPVPFLWEFITPILKVSKGVNAAGVSRANAQTLSFFSLADFQKWKTAHNDAKGWTVKYYKGLGTSTANEAKEYFGNLNRHLIQFCSDPRTKESLQLAFDSKFEDQRKEWLGRIKINHEGIDQVGNGQRLTYSDFVDKELILFSMASNVRSIPSVVDGLKPSQRKILFAAFKRKLKREIKVAQLSGYVSEVAAYHHGEQSLHSTIIGLAQNFVSNNNIALLLPLGQFGTRLQGGKDAASARYIFTTLSPVTRFIYHIDDDATLRYLVDDGQSVEPEWYVPVLPMVLVNGSSGIGTGWSSDVPQYAPRELVAHLRRMIDIHEGECIRQTAGDAAFATTLANATSDQHRQVIEPKLVVPPLVPWFKGFKGIIKQSAASANRFIHTGVIERLPNGTSIHISELPLYVWTGDYKVMLEEMIVSGDIVDFKEYHTDTRVSFVVEMTREQLAKYEADGIYKKFKLTTTLATSNMVLFDRHGKLKRYASANDVLVDFYLVRWDYYVKRKERMLAAKRVVVDELANKVRFIRGVCGLNAAERIVVTNRPKAEIVATLDRLKFLRIARRKGNKKRGGDDVDDDDDDDNGEEEEDEKGEEEEKKQEAKGDEKKDEKTFDYLMGMNMWALTKERATALQSTLDAERAALRALEERTLFDMWRRDLIEFEKALDAQEQLEAKLDAEADAKVRLGRAKEAVGAKNKAAVAAAAAAMIIKGTPIADTTEEAVPKKPARKRAHADSSAATASSTAATATNASISMHPIAEDDLDDDDDLVLLLDGPPTPVVQPKPPRVAPAAAAASSSSSSSSSSSTGPPTKRPTTTKPSAQQVDIRQMFSK